MPRYRRARQRNVLRGDGRIAPATVEAEGVTTEELSHPGAERGLWRLHHGVEMVVHQAVSVDAPAGALCNLPETGDESSSIVVVVDDLAIGVSPGDDVLDRIRRLEAWLARHRVRVAEWLRDRQMAVWDTSLGVPRTQGPVRLKA